MGKKKRAKPRGDNAKTGHSSRSAKQATRRIGVWAFFVLAAGIGACYLGWQSFRTRGHVPGESRPALNGRKSVLAGIAAGEPGLAAGATAPDLKRIATAATDALVVEFPDNVAAPAIAATLRGRLGETEEAAILWHACLEIDPEFADAYRHLGQFARDRGDFEEACKMFGQVVALGQASPQMISKLGDSLLQTGAAEEAIEVLTQTAAGAAVSGNSLLTLGQAYLQVKDFDKAEATFLRLIEAAPSNARAYYLLANVYARQGQREKSRECSDKFRTLAKVDYEGRAQQLRADNDISTLSDIAAQAFYQSGHMYAAEGRLTQAEEAWLKTAIIAPQHIQCRHELLYLLEQQERLEDAIEISQQLCELAPKAPDNWLNLGLLHAKLGQMDAALEALGKAKRLAPENPKYRQAYDLVREGM
jgi:tetratricopeptide (TPR) repeat protein